LIELKKNLVFKLDTAKIYNDKCYHTPKTNLLPIYFCCNKIYPCLKCHDTLEGHIGMI